MKVTTAEQYRQRFIARGVRNSRAPRSAVRGQRRADIRRFVKAVFGESEDSARGIPANHDARTVDIGTCFPLERNAND